MVSCCIWTQDKTFLEGARNFNQLIVAATQTCMLALGDSI